ncbi:MAG: UvrD-helicase domain-containing protein [Halioglobus sp.]
MTGLPDAAARATVLDPERSFCVSAPAGSGKTELLIQRYLCLLSRVQRPEQVLAITFTRKAAAEMRDRVMQALLSAASGEPCSGAHQQVTRNLALRALAADQTGNWQLMRSIARFNIRTIDSFCTTLTQQMPVLSQIGGQAAVQTDATPLYVEAVRELYGLLEEQHPVVADLEALLLHFDNDWARLQSLLVSMLSRREQWREYIGIHQAPEESEAYLVATIESLVAVELGELANLLAPYASELLALQQFSAANLGLPALPDFPVASPAELPGWRSLGNLLLTKDGDWRKAVNRDQGFPAGKGEPQQRKNDLKALLVELPQVEGLQEKLRMLRHLPAWEEENLSWRLALHLSRLLPALAAQLLLVFQRHGVVDHSQVAQSALLALGDDDCPTELALRLDYRIEHILVDEFQDTAITQYELLHKLTRGWGDYNEAHPGHPRTLMLVGDAMQSIYGFRGANVGLFLKAQQEGFNGVALHYVQLRSNFRSDAGVVNWVNETFESAFPPRDDVSRSCVRYRAASAVRAACEERPVVLRGFHGDDARVAETGFICEAIVNRLQATDDTIAVLGRSRSHLQPVITRLRQLGITCNAPELDSLARSPLVADLLGLCRALANEADRLAWMALLRAPWCGLRLADLLLIATASTGKHSCSVWSALQDPTLRARLSRDGRERVTHLLPVLQRAVEKRDRLGLRAWIEEAWLGLGGPECATEAASLEDAETFLQLLEEADAAGTGLDPDWLSQQLASRYRASGDPDSRVHVMTLHKAKGLEFDCVIIPQLDRIPRGDGREILLWDEHSDASGDRAFLLAADDHRPPDAPTLYNYLRVQRQLKVRMETVRLLYVGATRAVKQLVLTAAVRLEAQSGLPLRPSAHSLVAPIWESFSRDVSLSAAPGLPAEPSEVPPPRLLQRLRRDRGSGSALPDSDLPTHPVIHATYNSADNHVERGIGSVVQQALLELAARPALPTTCGDVDRQCWRTWLQREGIWGRRLGRALAVVEDSVTQALSADSPGSWMLSREHREPRSGWALTTIDRQGQVRDIVIDRSFVESATGLRWIIDYHYGRPAPAESVADFLARETSAYLEQLRCNRDAVRAISAEPLRCALYFTAVGKLRELRELDTTDPTLQVQ